MPFPSLDSTLAVKAHMYICSEKTKLSKGMVKVQSMKPKYVGKMPCKRYYFCEVSSD